MFSKRSQQIHKEPVARVVERELEVLLRVAKSMTLNQALAEDIVSQTMIIAFEKWEGFDGQHARSWLIQIMRNEWLQLIRKRNLRKEVILDTVAEPVEELFWQEVDAKIQVAQISQVIDSLPDDYRIAVTLCDIEDMSYEEAAASLDVTLGTLRSRLFRARKILRTRLVAFAQQ